MTLLEQEVLRLLAAAGLGLIIGLERESVDRGAGMRTHALVSTASALFTLISAYGFEDIVTANRTVAIDPTRIAAQVVTGIGFLGAGLIILRKNTVYGLTSAASVWAVAAIGMAAGAGMYLPAAIGTILSLVILAGLKPLEQRFFPHKHFEPFVIRVAQQEVKLATIETSVREQHLELRRLKLQPGDQADENLITLELEGGRDTSVVQLAEHLRGLSGVREVTYSTQEQITQHSERRSEDAS
jgi:putative Mg2+ transporter-C (MgtC) family protein